MITLAFWLIFLSIAHAGCSAPSPTATPSSATAPLARSLTSAGPPLEIASAAAPIVPTSVDYAARGRRDPFMPVVTRHEPAPGRSLLTVARLTGIVRSLGGDLALVETADGAGFILRRGEPFGEGRLLDIGEGFAVFEAPSSTRMPTRVVLHLEPKS